MSCSVLLRLWVEDWSWDSLAGTGGAGGGGGVGSKTGGSEGAGS